MIKSSELLTIALNDHLSEISDYATRQTLFICRAAHFARNVGVSCKVVSKLQGHIHADIDYYVKEVLGLDTLCSLISEIFDGMPHDFEGTAYEFRVNYTLMLIEYYKDQGD